MRALHLAPALFLFAGCGATYVSRELPDDHPANPTAPRVAFEPGPDPFAANRTYEPPRADGAAMDMDMGMSHGEGTGAEAPASPVQYTCPMHPEVVRDAPGTCPECGMTLRRRVPAPASQR